MSERSVLVTGASRGIGNSIAKKLLEEKFKVIGVSRNGLFPDFESHPNFTGLKVDLSNKLELKSILKPILQSDSCPDVLINNAGIADYCSFLVSDEDWESHWEKVMQVNLHTPTILAKWALPKWIERKQGTHIAIASRASYRGETEPFSAYAASKSGLIGVHKTIARGYGEHGVVSVAIAPGFTLTDMVKEAIPVYGEDYIKKDIVLNEVSPPEEIAELCALISSGKVRHLTGSTLHVNGGSYML